MYAVYIYIYIDIYPLISIIIIIIMIGKPQLGELRQVSSVEKRVNEARRMGFSRIIIPKQSDNRRGKRKRFGSSPKQSSKFIGIDCIEAEDLMNAIEHGLVSKIPKTRSKKKEKKSNEKDALEILRNDLLIDDDDDDDDDEFLY